MSDRPQTADPAQKGVLARIVAAHRRQAAAARDRTPLLSLAWERALRHAAVPFKALELVARQVDVIEHTSLLEAQDALPEHGLVAVLEDRDGARGLVALSHGTIDALVEAQTTGRVDARALPPRPVTRIDEALCRDFLDLSLAAFSRETKEVADRDWPQRMNFGSRVADRNQLSLLLPDGPYHVMEATVGLGAGGSRDGKAVLVVPRIRDLGPNVAPASGGTNPVNWRETLESALAEARLDLDAVLIRTTRSLREVEALAPGDTIGFDPSDLANVGLETAAGETVLHGRLGQIGGHRALRVIDGSAPGVTLDATDTAAHQPPPPMALEGATPALADPSPAGASPHAMPDQPPAPTSSPMPDLPASVPPDVGGLSDIDLPDAGSDMPFDPVGGTDASSAPFPQAAPLDFTPNTAPIDPSAIPD